MLKNSTQPTARAESKPQQRTGTQTIERAAILLRAVAGNNRVGLRLVDLVDMSGLEIPTTHRLLKSMVAQTLLKQDQGNRRYFLGPLMFEAGLATAHEFSLRDLCQDAMNRIADKTGDTVYLNIRRDHEQVCLDRKDGAFPVKVFTLDAGDRRPLGAGSGGMAILSAMRDDEAQDIIRKVASLLPRHSGLDERTLLSLVRRSRTRGYALRKVSGLGGGKAIGVPIRSQSGEPIAALSIAASASRMAKDRCEKLVALLRREIATIERQIISAQRNLSKP